MLFRSTGLAGVRLIDLEPSEKVVGVATLAEKETDEIPGNGGGNGPDDAVETAPTTGEGSPEGGTSV